GAHNFIANGIVVHNSKLTMKYPGVHLVGRKARGEVVSVAFSGRGQHQDAGAKMVHAAPETSSTILSKSISKDGGRTSYRGLVKVYPQAEHVKSSVRCDALLMDEISRSDTYPTMEIDAKQVQIGHEATVSKIGEEQLFYLMSRGLKEQEATTMVVNGFFEAFTKELPLEYAVELNRLIQLEMEGSVG
ncbi:MAG: SufD family Fe-S cluster assembly protein, partial [Candidatus Omnitrophica bacterium]|nr:SufD family Fe-S cluster assembly protein [Candidatus Omnitrophota bacterium]